MLATKAVRCDPIPQTSGLRRFTCKAETIHKPVATGRTMRLLRDLAARKEPLSEENEARAAGIYLRVIARMERVGEPAGAEAVKNERGRLSEAKELAETMIVSVEEMGYLRNLAAEKREALERGEERYIFTIYRRICPRLKNLNGAVETANAESELITQEIARLSAAKRLIETVVDHAMNRLIWRVAKHLHFPRSVSIEDLVQEGKIALITKSMRLFDPKRGYRFSTYGLKAVTQAMIRLIKEHHMMQTAHISDLADKVRIASESYRNSTGNQPTIEEIANLTGFPEITVKRCLALPIVVSIHGKSRDMEKKEWIDLISDKTCMDPLDLLLQDEIRSRVDMLLATLDPDVEDIVRKIFGVGELVKRTQAEIGKERGFTRARAGQKLNEGILELQRRVVKAPERY